MKQWPQVRSHLRQAFEMLQPVGWSWALFKNWARIIAMETAGYWVILKIWLFFSCLRGNWAKLKTCPWLGMLSTLKLILLLFGNFSRRCVLPVVEISLFSTGNFLKYYCSLFYIFLWLLSFSADTNISACQFQRLFQALYASVVTAC